MDNCGHSGYGALGKLKKAGKLEIAKGVTTDFRQDRPRTRVHVDRKLDLKYRKRKTHDKKI